MKDRFFELTMLFDYYGALLSEKQKETFRLYYFYDCSLNEIAETLKISKQAVSINLKRAEDNLRSFDGALKLLKQDQDESDIKKDIFSKLEKIRLISKDNRIIELIDEIETLFEKKRWDYGFWESFREASKCSWFLKR